MSLIGQAIAEAAAGRGNCLFLVGEAGAGKTRLLHEAAEQARRRGMTVLMGSPVGASLPPTAFSVLAQALRSWTRAHPLPTEELRPFSPGLRQVLPEWPLPAQRSADLSQDQMRLLIMEGALRLLLSAAQGAGALLALDDLQDADPETLQFLYHAAASIGAAPVLILCTVRVPEGQALEAQAWTLQRRGQATVLSIPPLDSAGVAALLQAVLGAQPPKEMVADLMAWTDGVPLLIEEALEAHMAAGTLRQEGGAWRWSGGVRSIVPRTVLEIVRQKLHRLPSGARNVLSAMALLRRMDADLLGRIARVDADALSAGLRQGVEAGLLDSDGTQVWFRHSLLREAVAGTLLPTERAELHRQAEQAIAALRDDGLEWLEARASHLEAMERRDEAATLLAKAGRLSLQHYGPASAEETLRRALSLAETPGVVDQARDALAEALGAIGRWDEALQLDAELTRRLGDTPERLARMARNAISAGRLDEADGYIERAAAAGVARGPLLALAALAALWRGDLEKAIALGQDALGVAESDGHPETACAALDVIGRAQNALGRQEAAAQSFRQWEEQARQAGLTMSRLQALMELGNVEFLASGRPDGLRQARKLAREAGAFTTLVLADLSLVWCLLPLAETDEAIACGEEALDLCRRLRLDLLPHALEAAAATRGLKDWSSVEPLVQEALSIAPGDPDVEIQGRDVRMEIAMRMGDYERALAESEEGLASLRAAPASTSPSVLEFLRIWALVALGRYEEAREALGHAKASPHVARLSALSLLLSAGEAMTTGSEEALEQQTRSDGMRTAPYYRAMALTVGAEAIRGPRAAQWLREALSIYEQAGMEQDAARVRQLLRTLGAPVPRSRRADASLPADLRARGVTRREAEVLGLLAQGLTNAEIAERLFLSVRTVEDYVSSLLDKLEAESRAKLMAIGLSLSQ
jgi:ATP/maltotriose-dependent transcriptional regulator MalT